MSAELDSFDYAILRILQGSNLVSQRDIGHHIGLSAPAVQRRIKRLRETGVIKADVSVLDMEQVGQLITIIVEVQMASDELTHISQAKALFANTPHVQQCYYVTGEADFILVLTVPTMQAYEALTKQLFFSNPHIKRFKTSITMDTVKAGFVIPLPT